MVTKTFEARVQNGRLEFHEALDAFEGQQVSVTIVSPAVNGAPVDTAPEPAPPEWLDVEKEVYVRMPLPGEVLRDVIVIEGGPLRPTAVFPEELSDD